MKGLARTSAPVFDHLQHMTDHRGLFEHALNDLPRRDHGYCVDDVARGLVVVLRQPAPGLGVTRLASTYLDFTLSAIEADGTVHNRMAVDGQWTDESGVGDWWGRALWGLGVAASLAPTADMRQRALDGFRRAAQRRSPDVMSLAFASLGAAELLRHDQSEQAARNLLVDLVTFVGPIDLSAAWPWPEPRLRYSNGHLVEALLLAGSLLPAPEVREQALGLLEFLLDHETLGDHISPTPAGGCGPDDVRPGFDQQPIEVAALADACATAYELTLDPRWLKGVERSWAWFMGANDASVAMCDLKTGGGFDGLHANSRNINQGAESTIAAISTAQHARQLELLK